jgi:DNA-binding MarR family transcriptional regulator
MTYAGLMRLELVLGIHRATHQIGLYIQRHAAGLGQAEAHILCHLDEAGDSPLADVHRAFAHKRSTLTGVLDRMEKAGLIRRETSPADRRSFVIRLTPAGKKKASRVHRKLESLEARVLRAADRGALKQFQQLIAALESAANESTGSK